MADQKVEVAKKERLPVNVLYNFKGGAVALDPKGTKLNKKGEPGKVRVTEYVPGMKYAYKVRAVGSGNAYGYVEESYLSKCE